MTHFKIYDWASNDVTNHFGVNSFNTFEDAWGAIYEVFEHLGEKEFDEQMGEFEVLPITARKGDGDS